MEKIANLLVALSDSPLYFVFIWSWQAALLLAVVWVALKFDRSKTAVVRHRIWLLGLIAVTILPLGPVVRDLVPLPQSMALNYVFEIPATVTAPLLPAGGGRSAPSPPTVREGDGSLAISEHPFDWAPLIWSALFFAWIAGAVITLVRFGISYWKLHRVRIKARAVSVAALDCSGVYWGSRAWRVSVAISPDVQSPVLAGLLRPIILLPADISDWTTPEERRSILQHELIHVKRRDHFVSLFQALLKAMFFFHPMIRYGCHQMNVERELACDEAVLSLGTRPAIYAESILKVAERNILPDAVHQPAAFASRKKLERRIDMILRHDRSTRLSRYWPFLVLPVGLMTMMIWLLLPGRLALASSRRDGPGAPRNGKQGESAKRRVAERSPSVNTSVALPSVDQILSRYVDALGGQSTLETASSRVARGTVEGVGQWIGDNLSGDFVEYAKAPNKYTSFAERSSAGNFKEGFNGTAGWCWTERWGSNWDWADDEVAWAKRQADFHRDIRLKQIYPKLAVIGIGSVGEREAYLVEGTPTDGGPERMYFDTKTGLLLRLNHKIEGWKHAFEDYFEDYREVDGIKVPFTRRRESPYRRVIKLVEVKYNVTIDDPEFERPGNNLAQGLRILFYRKLHFRNPLRAIEERIRRAD